MLLILICCAASLLYVFSFNPAGKIPNIQVKKSPSLTSMNTYHESSSLERAIPLPPQRQQETGNVSVVSTIDLLEYSDLAKPLLEEEIRLERSAPGLEYNALPRVEGVRYFMYTPSGGFNNQRLCLEFALKIAKILKRRLVVPMAGKHLNFWYRYYDETNDTLVPMDVLMDFNHMASFGVPVIPTNRTLKEIEVGLKAAGRLEVILTKERYNWKEKDVPVKLKSDAEVLFFKGHTMYHRWFSDKVMEKLHTFITYSKLIRRVAFEIMKQLGGKYHAIHVRLGDYAKATATRKAKAPDMQVLIDRLFEYRGYRADVPLYIATEPDGAKNRNYWRPVYRKYRNKNVFFAHDFQAITEKFGALFQPEVRGDFLGLVEQLVCVGAKKFVGSSYSNFSENIDYMRKYKLKSFPEAVLHWQKFLTPSTPA